MTTVLITQCLQRDFVDPIGPHDPLPNLLHVGYSKAERLLGPEPAAGPLAQLIQWARGLPADDRLKQLGLLARRPEEDARLAHARFMVADRGSMINKQPPTWREVQS